MNVTADVRLNVVAMPSFDDHADFEDADRGFIGALKPGIVRASNGRVTPQILGLLAGRGLNGIAHEGLDEPDPNFPIVTP
jgi:hypothetical protein